MELPYTKTFVRTLFVGLLITACENPFGETDQLVGEVTLGPAALSLSGNATFTTSPTISWTETDNNISVSYYELGIGTSAGSDNVVAFTNIGNVLTYQVSAISPTLELNTDYYFVLRSVDINGNTSLVSSSSSWDVKLIITGGGYQLPESSPYLTDCDSYLNSDYYNGEGDGRYWLDIDGAGGTAAFLAECDMNTDGGGWTLVLNYLHQGTTNPALTVLTTNLPLITSSTLGTDESTIVSSWGHAGNALVNTLTFSEARFYCQSQDHVRTMNFKTSHANTLTYLRTGAGGMSGIQGSFTALTGHNGNLPAAAANFTNNQGNSAMTAFPFMQSGVRHWGVRGLGGRWECDNNPTSVGTGAQFHTLHRVWVR